MTSLKDKLAAHIAKARTQEESSPSESRLLFWGVQEDKNYLPLLKGCTGSHTTYLRLDKLTTLTQLIHHCKQKRVTKVISTNVDLLKKLLNWDKRAAPKLSSYAGSYYRVGGKEGGKGGSDIEVVFLPPLKQLATVAYGTFLATRFISKLTKPEEWAARYTPTPYKRYTLLTASNEAELFNTHNSADICGVDIETYREGATIRCVSFTSVFLGSNTSHTVVLPIDSEYNLAILRKWCWNLKPAKVFQNGKYDLAYLTRYGALVYNYLYDTATLFHCWYSELPKDLGFLNSFFIREAVYWKDLSETNDLDEYYNYNGLDTWGTVNTFLAMIAEAPTYAINNYLAEFPLNFPCHLAEMTGIARDMGAMKVAYAQQTEIIDSGNASLDAMLGVENFNVASPKQMKELLKVLGCGDLASADEKNLTKARFRHPLNTRILTAVIEVRKARKLRSTYLTEGKEFTRPNGTGHRMLYSLNPHGTDTGRLASKSHHFWCGFNVQNVPRGTIVKSTFKADPGFRLYEVDLEQAESRDTAYISGDPALIDNVEHSPDFHCSNAAAFFGIPFEELYDIATGKVINKPIRQLGKPVNHGANYNMGAFTLVDTMGEKNLLMAKRLLGLNKYWSVLDVAEHLLKQFHLTYPQIKQVFYKGVINEVALTGRISSQAHHYCTDVESFDPSKSWVRRCFQNPSKSKSALNAYVAHPPQGLNAQTLNRSWLQVFHRIAINPEYADNFKLCAQVHDSILFQVRLGHEYLADMVKDLMEVPVTLKGYDGIIRTFTVPADTSNAGIHWSDLK